MANQFLPLVPQGDLQDERSGFKPYRECLETVFDTKELCNIAVMGPKGSGKSSILRSFDTCRQTKTGEKAGEFLYVSLIDFEGLKNEADTDGVEGAKSPAESNPFKGDEAPEGAAGGGQGGPANDQEQKAEKTETDKKTKDSDALEKLCARLEYSILCQLLVRCDPEDLSGCSLAGVPAAPPDTKKPAKYLATLFALIFGLMFEDRAGAMLRALGMGPKCRIILHAMLYGILGGMLYFGVKWLLKKYLPRLKLQSAAVKHGNLELSLAVKEGRMCLDQYRFDMICILDRIYDKIGGTVVFEDMERLDPQTCVALMTKLRELNGLVNTYRRRQGKAESPLRFLYVISDEVFPSEERSKFFDFIMPVIPVLNEENYLTNFAILVNSLGIHGNDGLFLGLLGKLKSHLRDMRTVRNIVGEFQLLLNICLDNGHLKENIDLVSLLALTCCKVIWPKEMEEKLLWGSHRGINNYPELADIYQEFVSEHTMRKLRYSPKELLEHQMYVLQHGSPEEKLTLLEGLPGYVSDLRGRIWKEGLLFMETDPGVKAKLHDFLMRKSPPSDFLSNALSVYDKLTGKKADEFLFSLMVWVVENKFVDPYKTEWEELFERLMKRILREETKDLSVSVYKAQLVFMKTSMDLHQALTGLDHEEKLKMITQLLGIEPQQSTLATL